MRQSIKKYGLLYGAFIIYSGSSICAKLASQQDIMFRIVVFMFMEILCLGIYAVVWQQVLKDFSLVTAMASKGVVVIINLIWSVMLFAETVTFYNVLGAIIIIFGIWMVSSDG